MALASGVRLGAYEIVALVGAGGMGEVYRARDTRLNRVVALKMLAGGQVRDEELARFRGEAEAVARLHHAHIVQIYEIGEHAGRPYLALEYVDGGSLDRRLDGTPQPARQAAQLVETLAQAMHHAHQAGIIHRDLKPGNVLLDADGTPYVTDFGLAKKVDGDSNLTQSGAIVGTVDEALDYLRDLALENEGEAQG